MRTCSRWFSCCRSVGRRFPLLARSNKEGNTPLHLACLSRQLPTIEVRACQALMTRACGLPLDATSLAMLAVPSFGPQSFEQADTSTNAPHTLHTRLRAVSTPHGQPLLAHITENCDNSPSIPSQVLLAAGSDMDVPNARGQSPASLCASIEARQLFEEERAKRQRRQETAPQQEGRGKLERMCSFKWYGLLR